jgi:hypothetical protein
MDPAEQARRFAQTAYAAKIDEIVREFEEKRQRTRAQMAARGAIMSGNMIFEDAKLDGQQIAATIKAQLETRLEGYELHGVPIDDDLASTLAEELNRNLADSLGRASIHSPGAMTLPAGLAAQYPRMVSEQVGISPAWIRTEIDRRRLMKKPQAHTINVYHVEGDNSRVNVNSNDNSVNVVTKKRDEIFTELRQQVESGVQEGNERTAILEKLTALEQAQGSRSFAERYSDFIAVAANHMAVIGPFIPALTEMLRQALA